MIILPYSTALNLAKTPVVTCAMVLICCFVFLLQIGNGITEDMLYYPESWNPVKMLTCALAHLDLMHLAGNMVFYLAFAPALETLIANKLRYVWIMCFISLVAGISYSISIYLSGSDPHPTLGFSGVVSGMIGLAAYLMPRARIRVFFWYIFVGKTIFVPAWILAVFYIGLDTWEMMTETDHGGINVVAHVAGGFAGYFYGVFWLRDRKQFTGEELATEIDEMKVRGFYKESRSLSFSRRKEIEQQQARRMEAREQDKFMGRVYKMVGCHRDSDAVYLLMDKYDHLQTQTHEFEDLFDHIEKWGPSRTLLCIGRIIIYKLDRERRYGRAIAYIAKCQEISPRFVLPELSRIAFYAEMAIDCGRLDVAEKLLVDPGKRYGGVVDTGACDELQKIIDHGGVMS